MLILGIEGGEVSSRFPCVTPGISELSLKFIASEVPEFSACLYMIKSMVFGFCSIGG